MKAEERHHLKQNEFAATMTTTSTWVRENKDRIVMGGVATIAIVAIAGVYLYLQKRSNDQAGALFGIAMSVTESPIAPPPTVPGAKQTPGTFPSDKDRQEAAIKAFQEVVTQYPSSTPGIAAKYESASILLSLGRFQEAEHAYQDVVTQAPSSLYGPLARLGLAETLTAETQYDKAIQIYTDLAGQRDGALPVDGVLMQMARTYVKAGKTQEARATFKRVVDEFASSPYSAAARTQLAQLN